MQTDRDRELGADRQGKGNWVQTDGEKGTGCRQMGKRNQKELGADTVIWGKVFTMGENFSL